MSGKLGCNVYVDANVDRDVLINDLARFFNVDVNGLYVENQSGYLCVDENDEFDEVMRKDDDDGFLYYRYLVEIQPSSKVDSQNQIGFVSDTLNYLWGCGYPAIASCDYEELLPNNGGYKSQKIPQPQ